ncbi:MAG: enoyl-CoA hydratase [Acidimicrobiaceae bacterium]|jgi:enoyl-CoA hydratase
MVDYELQGRVAVLTLNRPEARNAVNGDIAQGMEDAIDRLEDDDEAWVAILTHTGPVFSAGADLKAINAGQVGQLQTKRGGFAGFVQRERTKPVIAAVDGPAFAGGCEIALACDLIVASTQAKFGLPEVKRSLAAAAGGLFRLPRILPRPVALEMIMTGDPIDAERAHHFGLVNDLCEPGQALERAHALAARIVANAPLAVRKSREIALAAVDADDEVGWKLSAEAMVDLSQTEDFWEGPKAFIEKRDPVWKGK